jgi:hypothetical protein
VDHSSEKQTHRHGHHGESRRDFLKRSLGLAAAALYAETGDLLAQEPGHATTRQSSARGSKSRIIRITPERLMPLGTIQQPFLKHGITEGLCRLTGEAQIADAWHRILKHDDQILLKFSQSGSAVIGTTPLLAAILVESLTSAGWAPEKIAILEADTTVPELRATRRADTRWQGEIIEFGASGKDSFIAALDQATAVINVPFLKTHHLATMTGSLKNLSHGLIRHPAKFHANGCDPAIGEIVASEAIQSKMRLNIVNALRVVCEGGPSAHEKEVHMAGTLLFGKDPVACDAIGYNILNEARSLRGLPPLLGEAQMPKQLVTAFRLGLGQADAEQIEVESL